MSSSSSSGSSHRLYVKAKHVSFQRGKRRSNPDISILKLDGVGNPKDAQFYVGKKVVFIYRAKKEIRGSKIRCIWGKIRRTHGNTGAVRANFRSNLPPKTLGATLRVMLYPSNI